MNDTFWSKVTKSDAGCWLWTAATDTNGYGVFGIDRVLHLAHRVSYETLRGPIPDGLVLDHVKERGCVNKNCVNPDHLEPVTHRVNILRGDGVAAVNARKTHCLRDHEFTEENTYVDPRGYRQCRACRRLREEAFA